VFIGVVHRHIYWDVQNDRPKTLAVGTSKICHKQKKQRLPVKESVVSREYFAKTTESL
jgi:hypothetical protein